ncbi:MAG TPA: hypothetical protein DCE76_08630 [Anaerolineaceae bacterium]|nr:hypothetical protein [Anaerolineaceae bacterium]
MSTARKCILIVVLVCFTLIQPAQAQSSPPLESLLIQILPEFDRPDVLVIYRLSLAASVSLPAQISLRIPRAAGAPYNVAWEDVDGLLYNLAYTTEVRGDWLQITFTTPSANLQVEYYDPRLEREDALRKFTYEWNGDFSVQNLTVSVQQPANAEKMQAFPGFDDGQRLSDGFIYYTNPVGKVEAGTTFKVNLRYEKADDSLSVGMLPVQPAQPLDENTPGRTSASALLPVFLLVIGGVLLVVLVAWFLIRRDRESSPSTRRHRHRRPAPASVVEETSSVVYCHQCGRRAEAGDLFCRTCGVRLRKD